MSVMSLKKASLKQIRKAVTSDFIGSFSSSLFNFAISLYILRLTGSALNFGITLMIGPLIGLIFAPITGFVSDHFDNKRVMMITQTGCVAMLLIYSIVFVSLPQGRFLLILLMVATIGLNLRIFSVTYRAAASRMVDTPYLQKLNSLEQSSTALAQIVGPIAAGVIFSYVPFQAFIYFEIISELLVILIVSTMNFHLIKDPEEGGAIQQETVWSSMRHGLAYVKQRKVILYLILIFSIFNFFTSLFNMGFPYLIIHVLRLENIQYSLTESMFSVGLVLGGLIVARQTFGENALKVASRAIFLVGVPAIILLLPLTVPLNSWVTTALFGLIDVVSSIALVYINVLIPTYMQETIPANYQGRVFTILTTGATSLQPLGMLVYSILFQYVSPLVIISVTVLCFLVLGLTATRLLIPERDAIARKKIEQAMH